MRRLALLLCLAALTSFAQAQTPDLSGFDRWVQETLRGMRFDHARSQATLYVAEAWDDEATLDAYRMWFAPYVICGTFKDTNVTGWGFDFEVLLASRRPSQRFKSQGHVPFATCTKSLENIRKHIESSKK